MIPSEPLIVLVLIALAWWIWNAAMRARECVLAGCRRICAQMRLQLLDQTIALSRLSLGRDAAGRLCLRRWYVFEFSTNGTDRHRGSASLQGGEIQLIRLEHPEGPVIVNEPR